MHALSRNKPDASQERTGGVKGKPFRLSDHKTSLELVSGLERDFDVCFQGLR